MPETENSKEAQRPYVRKCTMRSDDDDDDDERGTRNNIKLVPNYLN